MTAHKLWREVKESLAGHPRAHLDVLDADFEVAAACLDRTWVLPDGTSTDLTGLLAWASLEPKQTVYLTLHPDKTNRDGWRRPT